MELRIVSDRNGNITDADNRKIVGTIQEKDLYTFYVQGAQNDDGGYEHIEVKMVLPVGGNLSGLYRFPRVGEKVLVESAGTERYLLGYVPEEGDTPFAPAEGNPKTTKPEEKDKLLADQQGMVLRYQQTGKTTPKSGEEYSEIGFYHQATSWEAGETVKSNYKEFSKNSKDEFTNYPKIDHIKIQSTGDIRAKAQNHYQTQAKRFELLVDCDEADHTAQKPAFEDMPGDDSNLYAGDAHIRAKNRIVIKAGDEIVLEVGRSTVRINDSGVTLSSKKVKGNFVTPWNTVLSLTPRDGIKLFGQHITMQGVFDCTLSDAMGGSFSSLGGIVRVLGKDIKAKTLSNIQYLGKQGAMTSQFGVAVDAMRSGMLERLHGDVDTASDKARALGKGMDVLFPLVATLFNCIFDEKTEVDSDPIQFFVLILDILVKINAASCGVLAESMVNKAQLQDHIRDQINLAQMVVEFGLMTSAAISMVAGQGFGTVHTATFHLRGTAHIDAVSRSYKLVSTDKEDAAAPLAGMVDTGVNKAIEVSQKAASAFKGASGLAKAGVITGVLGLVAVLGAGGLAGGNAAILNPMNASKEHNTATLDALMEL